MITPNYIVILTRCVHVLLLFYLYFQCYVVILFVFQIPRAKKRSNLDAKWRKNGEFTLKTTCMTFSMGKAIRRMMCPTHQWPIDQFLHTLGRCHLPSFVRVGRLESGLVWSPTHPMHSYILSHEFRNLSLDILDLGTL